MNFRRTLVKGPVPGPYSTTTSPDFRGISWIMASPSCRELGQIDPIDPGLVRNLERKWSASTNRCGWLSSADWGIGVKVTYRVSRVGFQGASVSLGACPSPSLRA